MADTDPLAEFVPCGSCGVRPLPDFDNCRHMWEVLLARSFDDPPFGRFHRAIVDLYCMQHPEQYMKRARSYAAHLTGTCVLVELDGNEHVNRRVQRWLSEHPDIRRPCSVAGFGELGLDHLLTAAYPAGVAGAVREWADSIWAAYRSQHDLCHRWLEAALGRPLSEIGRST